MFDLAHITDVHQPPLPRATLMQLLSKRFFGFLSWHHRRHRRHRIEALNALLADLVQDPPNHIAVTGDLVNISLPEEFRNAAVWLARLGPPGYVSLIPGNHDAYIDGAWQSGGRYWSTYMQGDDGVASFPFVRRIGPVALIGLSTAVPTGIGWANGWLGESQLDRLPSILAELAAEKAFRVIMIHHPPLGGRIKRRRGLADEAAFRAVIVKTGAELVLSGHEHRFLFGDLPGPSGPVPVFAGPSASLSSMDAQKYGGYLRFRFDPESPDSLQVEIRRFDPTSRTIVSHQHARVARHGDGLRLEPLG